MTPEINAEEGAKKGHANPTSLQIACPLSAYLKTLLGHTHFYDRDILLLSDNEGRGPLQKYPVLLDRSAFSTDLTSEVLAMTLSDTKSIANLQAVGWAPFGGHFEKKNFKKMRSEVGEEKPMALIELRAKYSRMFDRALEWVAASKSTDLFGIRIYRMTGFFVVSFILLNAFLVTYQGFAREFDRPSAIKLLAYGAVHAALFSVFAIGVWKGIFRFVIRTKDWIAPFARSILSTSLYSKLHRRFQMLLQAPYAFDWAFRLTVVLMMLFPYRDVPDLGVLESMLGSIAGFMIIPAEMQPDFSFSCEMQCRADFLNLSAALTLPASALFYFVSRIRSKKVIQLYTSLLAHIRYAQILESVIQNVFKVFDTRRPASSDLGIAERIIIEKLRLEKEKRSRLLWSVSVASAAALLYLIK